MRLKQPRIISAVTAAAVALSAIGMSSIAFADSGGPSVLLASSTASTTSATSIPVTVTFSASVTGFTSSDLSVSNGTVSDFTGSGASYSFNLNPTATGTVSVSVPENSAAASDPPHKQNENSNLLVFSFTPADVTAPVISNVSVMPSATSTTISWTTDEATQGQVSYGLTSGYGSSTTLESSATTTHSVTITGLTASTLYHFQISATDASDNTATTTDDTFTTLGALLAPVVSGVTVTNIGSTTATVTWNTDVAASSQVFYGLTAGYGSSSTLNTTASTSHSVTLTGLDASTTYHFQVASANAVGTTTSADATFTTTSGSSTPSAPVISGISVTGIGTSTATVSWNTTASSTQLMYGTTTGYGSSSTLDTTASSTHSVTLTNLTEATLYHFQIVAANGVGTTTSSDQTFTTSSTSSSTPLAVTGIDAIKTDATADDTFLHGWEWIMHLTVPDLENAFRMKFSDFVSGSSTIPAANNIRIFSSQSTNATSTASAVYATDNDYGDWLYLAGDTSTTTPGRQVDVDIQVKVPSGTPNGSYSTTYGAQSIPSTATSTTP
ncbi:MAG: fibronectin type III domain-containing protein [Bacillota bacterium]